MQRFKLTLEYDGSPFCGWQRQTNGLSVQQVLEEAAARIAGEPVTAWAAGRTDAGVHALGQVAHSNLNKDLSGDKLRDALNYHMRPNPVAVIEAEPVDEDFHARFSARARHYLYRIIDRRAELVFDKRRAWRAISPINAEAMHAAAQALVGKHDFTTFRDSQCQADSPVKSLSEIAVSRRGEEVRVTVSAPSFLHRQVRSIVGSLMEVGRGKQPVRWMAEILAAAERAACGPVAPPDGLYLTQVDY